MERDDKIYALTGFFNMQDDCSGCWLNKIKNNCDFYNMPDEKINQLYEILEKRTKETRNTCPLNR